MAKKQSTPGTGIRDTGELFRKIFESSPLGIALVTKELSFFSVNPAWTAMTGYSEGELQNLTVKDITHPDYYAGDRENIQKLVSGTIPIYKTEKRYIRKDGSTLWGRLMVTVISGAFGTCDFLVAQIEDITEQKAAEEALRESKRMLQQAQEMAHLGFWTWDVKTGAVEWSDEVFRIFGRDKNEFTPQIDSILELSPWPEDHQRDKELIRKAMESHKPGTYEQRFLRPDMSTGYYHSTFEGRYDAGGDLVTIIGTVLDTTERRKAEEALRESEGRFRTLAEQLPVGIVMTRKDALDEVALYYNRKFTEITGYSLETAPTFETWTRLAYPDPEYRSRLISQTPEIYAEASRDITSRSRVSRVTCSNGTEKDIEFRFTDLEAFGFWTVNDITDRLWAEQQRETLINELEQKNGELEQFTYTVSHDMKSPLITIRGFAGLLENEVQGGDPVKIQKYIQRITNAAETMEQLLTDLIELSRAGKIIHPPEPVAFGTIAREAVDLLEGLLAERGVTVEIAPDLPEVYVDHTRIREVIVNVMENAIKFLGDKTDPHIRVGVETGGPMPVFFIQDNGIGIDPRYLERIFNLFEKLNTSVPGTGIGLPLARRIIEMHGGKIWAESEGPGMGTTFRFTLPVTEDQSRSGDT